MAEKNRNDPFTVQQFYCEDQYLSFGPKEQSENSKYCDSFESLLGTKIHLFIKLILWQ